MRFLTPLLPFLAAAMLAGASREVSIAEPPTWLSETPAGWVQDRPEVAIESGPIAYLLIDRQENVATEEDYFRLVQAVQRDGGLEDAGDLSISFDPEYEEVVVHQVHVRRGEAVIDKLTGASFRYLEQEPEAWAQLYDGRLTALLVIPDLRVGDIVDFSYTVRGRNPVFDGHYFADFGMGWSEPARHQRVRVITPSTRSLQVRPYGPAIPEPTIQELETGREYTWLFDRMPAYVSEGDSPDWHDAFPGAELSEFASWAQVVDWALPLYSAADDTPDPGLRDEVTTALADVAPGESQAAALLAWVQANIRYLGIELGVSSHQPHPPADTFARRFGDCKDKALLLVQLLRAAGWEANPVLVNTVYGEKLDEQLPSPGAFDHVIVGLLFNKEWLWIDPTLAAQKGPLLLRGAPDYGYGLMIATGETQLRNLVPPDEARPRISIRENYLNAGFGGAAVFKVLTEYRGTATGPILAYLEGSTAEQITQDYREYYSKDYPEVRTVNNVTWTHEEDGVVRVREHFEIPQFWVWDEADKSWGASVHANAISSQLPDQPNLQRHAPLSVQHPSDITLQQELQMPDDWDTDFTPHVASNAYFDFSFNGASKGARLIKLSYHYQTKASAVPAAALADYMKEVDRVRDELSYTFTSWPDGRSESDASYTLNILLVLVALGSFGVAMAGAHLFLAHYHQQPPPLPGPAGTPVGIAGWLVLPAILVVRNAVILPITCGQAYAPFFDLSYWAETVLATGASFDPAHAYLNLVKIIANMVIIGLSMRLAFAFFQRHRAAPRLLVTTLWIQGSLLMATALIGFGQAPVSPEDSKAIANTAGALLLAVVWTTYLSRSHRVRNTFTR